MANKDEAKVEEWKGNGAALQREEKRDKCSLKNDVKVKAFYRKPPNIGLKGAQ